MGSEHEELCLEDRLVRERQVNCHLVAIEVGVETGTSERVELYSLTLDHLRLERQDTVTVQCRRTVKEYRVPLHDVLEDLIDNRFAAIDDLLRRLDGLNDTTLDELTDDERLIELCRHLFRETTLVHLELRTHDDDGTRGVVHTFTEEVLTETSLFTLQRVGEGFEGTVRLGLHRGGLTRVIKEGVHRLLEHTLLVTEDDIRRFDLHESFETVITDDDTTVEVVEVGSSETSTIQWYEGTELRRCHGDSLEDHPLRTVLTFRRTESLYHLQTLERLLTALRGSSLVGGSTEVVRELVEVDAAEEVIDSLSTHLDDDLIGVGILEELIILRHDRQDLLVLILVEEHLILNLDADLIVLMLLTYLLSEESTCLYDEVLLVIDDGVEFLSRYAEQRCHLRGQ